MKLPAIINKKLREYNYLITLITQTDIIKEPVASDMLKAIQENYEAYSTALTKLSMICFL